MKKIKLRTKTKGGCTWIVAKELDNDDNEIPKSDGSVDSKKKDETIRWKHGGTVPKAFIVKFFANNGSQGWPFKNPSAPTDNCLKVPRPPPPPGNDYIDTTVASNTSDVQWKYEVEVENDSTIEKLDPMIIIRGRPSLTKLVLAAGAGLLVGALLTWFLLRPAMGLGS